MARSLPKVCPFLVTVDLKLKWPEYPVARITPWPELPRPALVCKLCSYFGCTKAVTALASFHFPTIYTDKQAVETSVRHLYQSSHCTHNGKI